MPRPAPPRDPSGAFLSGLAFLAAGVLAVAVPLVWDSRAMEMFREPKSELALAAWAVLATVFLVRNIGGGAWRDPWWAAWGGVLAGGAVSALACRQPVRALVALAPLAVVAAGWGAVRQLPEERRRSLAGLVIWTGVIEAVAVLAFLRPEWRPESFALLALRRGRWHWIGTFGNPADAAVFLVLPALLAAGRAVSSRRGRVANGVAAALMVAVILGTQTLTTLAALVAGALVLIWRRAPRRLRLPLLVGAVGVVAVLFVATPLARRVRSAIVETRAGGVLWLGSARFFAYAAAGSMLSSQPATGVGFGLYGANSFAFQAPDALAERGRILGLQTGFGEAHNDLLQHAAETGLVGVLLAAAGFVIAWRRRRRGEVVLAGTAPLAAAAFALALTQFPLHLAAVAAQWALLAALAVPALPPPRPVGIGAGRARVLAAGVLIGAAIVLVWRHYRAITLVQQGKVLSASLRAPQVPPERRATLARAALANLEPALKWLPYSWNAALIAGNLAVDAGSPRLAVASFDRALSLAERPEVQFDVGIALRMAGDGEAGMTHLERAVELNPAIFREVRDPALAAALRRRLDASGYGARHPWIYESAPAAAP